MAAETTRVQALQDLLAYCESSETHSRDDLHDESAAVQWRRRANALLDVLAPPTPPASDAPGAATDGAEGLRADTVRRLDAMAHVPSYSTDPHEAFYDAINRIRALRGRLAAPPAAPVHFAPDGPRCARGHVHATEALVRACEAGALAYAPPVSVADAWYCEAGHAHWSYSLARACTAAPLAPAPGRPCPCGCGATLWPDGAGDCHHDRDDA